MQDLWTLCNFILHAGTKFQQPRSRIITGCKKIVDYLINSNKELNFYWRPILEAELFRDFVAWSEDIPDHTLAGQNVSFDRDYIKAAAERAGESYSFAYRSIDTHTLAYMHIIKRGKKPPFDKKKRHSALNLDAVLNYTGIPAEPEPHNALTGALSHAEVISRLMYDKPLLPEFAEFPIPWLTETK